jgi:very-short-patch-repair endonuclease
MRDSRFSRTRATTALARKLRRDVSRTEARLWLRLRNSQLGEPFRRQHPVGPYFADYACVPLKLVVEVDGPTHDLGSDLKRDQYMEAAGWTVLRFTLEDMDEHIGWVVETIHARLALLRMANG